MSITEKKEVVIYQTKDGKTSFEVNLEKETVWLNQKQMAELFDKNRKTITEHIGNLYKENELDEIPTSRKFRLVQKEGNRNVTRDVEYYNLDVIISIGYRVNSKRGTQFRIWATSILKQHIIDGYSLNEKRLREKVENFSELQSTIELMSRVINNKALSNDEARGLLKVISDYNMALSLLDDYDHQKVEIRNTTDKMAYKISYDEAKKAIFELKEKFGDGDLFGHEKDESFKSSINTIYQSFDGEELYPSIEEKAANLLYFIVKNHSFSDGNKRIAAFIFIWFLDINDLLYRGNGDKRLADNALVALTLMIAESKTAEKDIIVKVIVNLINQDN